MMHGSLSKLLVGPMPLEKIRPAAVLVARRPGGEWATRNDRYYVNAEGKGDDTPTIEQQVERAQKEMQQWQGVEPETEYRVIVCCQSDLGDRRQRYLDWVK